MPSQLLRGSAAEVATHLSLAFNGSVPGNPIYTSYTSEFARVGEFALTSSFAATYSNDSNAALASRVLGNLGVTSASIGTASYASIETAVITAFAAYPNARGQVALNLARLLTGLEGDVTYGSVATAWNNNAAKAFTYSSNVSNTVSTTVAALNAPVVPVTPSLSLTTSATSVNEGSTVLFTLDTKNVAPGTEYSYVITGVSAADVVGGTLSGVARVDSTGKALITVSLVADAATEGAETISLSVAGLTASVSVADTSLTPVAPVATYSLAPSVTSVNEGSPVIFTLTTTNVAAGAVLSYVISGVSAADVVGGSLTGTVTVGADGKAVIPVTLVADATTEGAETLSVAVGGATASVAVNDTSLTVIQNLNLGLTTGVDTTVVGGAGNDTFSASIGGDGTAANGTTLGASDNVPGGDGADRLMLSISGTNTGAVSTQGFTLSGIETLEINNYETSAFDNTLNMALVTGLTTVSVTGSSATGDTALTNLGNLVAASMAYGSGDLNLGYTAATVVSTSDTQSLTVSGQTGGTFTANGIETVSITSSGTANTVQVTAAPSTGATTTINVSGSANLTLTEGMTDSITRVNASSMTGNLTFTTDDTTNMSITGGSGNDSVVFGANFNANDSVDGGAGTDNLTVGATIASAAVLANVTNVEQLTLSGASVNATFSTNVGPTTFVLSGAGANTLTLNGTYSNPTTVNVGAGDTVAAALALGALTVNATEAGMVGTAITANNATTAPVLTDRLNLTTSSLAPTTITLATQAIGIDSVVIVDAGDSATTGLTTSAGFDISITTGAVGHNVTVDASALDASLVTDPADGTAETLTFDGSGAGSTRVLNVTGGAAQDTITGGQGNDILNGGAGNDSINGASGGADSISGGLGADTINMGAALTTADTIDGGDGNDTLIVTGLTAVSTAFTNVSNVETLVFSGASTFTLNAPVSFTTIDMDNGATDNTAQTVTLAAGFTGSPTFLVDAGDSITNTANATLTVNSSDATMATTTITGGTGTDTLNITPSSTTAVNVSLANLVTGVEVINVLDAGDLNAFGTTAATGGRDSTITTGNYASATTVAATLTINASTLDASTTYVDAAGASQTVSSENLTVDGSGIANALVRLSVTGGAGNDSLTGGAGNDILIGGSGTDTLTAGSGVDSISGGDGSDRIVMAGNLTSVDTIDGGSGTNTMTVTSLVDGDLINTSNVQAIILAGTATLGAQAQRAGIATVTTHTTAAAVDASAYTTGLTIQARGAGINQALTGGQGDDTFRFGGNFVDTTTGANDGDTFDGNDTVTGGLGNDTISVSNAAGAITPTLDLNTGKVTGVETILLGTASGSSAGTSQNITLTISDITLTTVQTVSISAAAITDAFDALSITNNVTTTTGGTSFSITGGAGNDNLVGGVNNDTIVGGGGADTLTGGSGADQLTGGSGNDVFVITGSVGTGRDTITDLQSGDRLSIAVTAPAANTTYDFTSKGAVTSSGDASASFTGVRGQYVFNTANSTLLVDMDGSGFITGTDTQAVLQGVTSFDGSQLDISLTADTDPTANEAYGITTGGGNDTFVFAGTLTSADTINGGAGNDTLTFTDAGVATSDLDSVTNVETITLGAAATAVTLVNANVAANARLTINGTAMAGNNTAISGAAEADGNLTMSITSTTGTVSLVGGAGNDSLTATTSDTTAATLTGGAGDDTLTVTVTTTAGVSSSATATLEGGTGSDTITGGINGDTIVYLLTGDLFANNVMFDSVNGGLGTDVLSVGTSGTAFTIAAADSFARMSNVETISAVNNTAAVSITLGTTAQDAGIRTVTMAGASVAAGNVIDVSRLSSDMSLTGGSGATSITGGSGNDAMVGGAGIDTITGGLGNDTITGAAGADVLSGGDGDDTFVYATAAAFVTGNAIEDTVTGGNGTDTIRIDQATAYTIANTDSFARAATIETLAAGAANAGAISITLAATAFTAGIRTVTLAADTDATGTNVVNVSAATSAQAISVTGSAGVDQITGGAGADTITGGLGADVITGGLGADTIVLTEATPARDQVVITSGLTSDTVSGFTVGSAASSDVFSFDIAALQTAGAVVAGVTLKLADTNGSDQITAGNATVQSITGASTLGASNTALYVSGTYATTAALIDALGAGGSSTARLLTVGANGVTANDTLPIVWSDGTNTYIGLLRFVNGVGAGTVADADMAIYTVATVVGVTDASTVVGGAGGNINFI